MPRAVVCRELGPPESLKLEDIPRADLSPGQVRVAIHAAGLNFPDILMAAGDYSLSRRCHSRRGWKRPAR